jgi:T5SS/PEP-CTERM-associated repeat protein/autotransporter-associated beta strand protein
VLLPGGFIFGIPQTINIGGSVLEVRLLEATNHANPSPYTFINGTIEIYLTGGNSILTRNTGGSVTVDADIAFPDVATGPRFNVEPTAPPIVVNGNITTSGPSNPTVVLELTSRNLALPSSVTVNGVISDTESRPLALTAGFAPDSENHRGTVTLTGANTYRGPTIVNGAVLEFNSIGNVDVNGIASALGAPRNTADGTIRLGALDANVVANPDDDVAVTGTLRYVGGGHTTDRAIALSADGAGGVIESSGGGGPLVFTASEFQLDATGGKTLTLGGTNAEANEIQADLVEISSGSGGGQGGPLLFVALLKEGDGTWILSGTNSYSGDTIVDGGQLEITGGGSVTDSSRGYIGLSTGSTGAVTVSGTGSAGNPSTWNSGQLNVGAEGDGTLNITDGGLVTNSNGYIGEFTGSTGAVTVSGTDSDGIPSTWTNTFELRVGYRGNGTLDVTGGGLVTNTAGSIGFSTGSTGAVTVSGTDSAGIPSTWMNSGGEAGVLVGREGDGTMDITGGGLVTNSSGGVIGSSTGSTGAVTVSGTDSAGNPSTWTNSSELYVGNLGNGTLDVTGGGLVSVGTVLTIDDDGDGDGLLNMATGGMLALYGGNADDSLSQFLDLVLGTKAIRYWDSSLPDWRPITEATPGEDYTLEYLTTGDLAGYTLLTVGQLPGLPGDYNGNGVVDAADYTVWRDTLGQSGFGLAADGDGDDMIDQDDYDLWVANFGMTAGSGAGSGPAGVPPTRATVPEPASATLIAMASLLLLSCGRLGCRDNK